MSTEFVPTENNIQELLKKLGADQKPYPKELLDSRRSAYVKQVTSVISSGPHFGNGQGQGTPAQGAAPMTSMMKAVLTVLVVANVALATYLSMLVYENWDKVQELLFGVPAVSETSPVLPEILTEATEPGSSPEIAVPPESIVSPVGTPVPTDLSGAPQTIDGEGAVDSQQVDPSEQIEGTPDPNNDDSGLHLGQTPHGPDDPPSQDSNSPSQDKNPPGQDNNPPGQDNNNNKNK